MKPTTLRKTTLDCNTIIGGRFIHAGEILDVATLKSLPPHLKQHLVEAAESAPAAAEESALANFQLNVPYRFDREGRLRARDAEREAAEQHFEAIRHDEISEQLQHQIDEPDETIASAVEAAQQDHEAFVGLQKAQAQVNAERADEAEEHLEKPQDEARANADWEGFSPASPLDEDEAAERISSATLIVAEPAEDEITEVDEWRPKPRIKTQTFVRRGSKWYQTTKIKHFRPGEKVFVKTADDEFESISVVNKRGELPIRYEEEE